MSAGSEAYSVVITEPALCSGYESSVTISCRSALAISGNSSCTTFSSSRLSRSTRLSEAISSNNELIRWRPAPSTISSCLALEKYEKISAWVPNGAWESTSQVSSTVSPSVKSATVAGCSSVVTSNRPWASFSASISRSSGSKIGLTMCGFAAVVGYSCRK